MDDPLIVEKIYHNPAIPKYRAIKTSGENVQLLLETDGCEDYLIALGFHKKADRLVMRKEPNLELLRQAIVSINTYRKQYHILEAWEIFADDLTLSTQFLGKGKFGEVFQGTFHGQTVAVKTLTSEFNTDEGKRDFLKEADIMKEFKHNNVMGLLGVLMKHRSENAPICIILELMPTSLLEILQKEPLDLKVALDRAMQLAAGMEYIHHRNVLHCDLAARNVLASPHGVLKICDFGLARIAGTDECDFSSRKKEVQFPIRWMAPEVFTESILTKASDVWAYGILVYEIFTQGGLPYPNMSNKEVRHAVRDGYRLPGLSDCPAAYNDVMQACWKPASARPDFSTVVKMLMAIKLSNSFALHDAERENDPSKPSPLPSPASRSRFSLSIFKRDTPSKSRASLSAGSDTPKSRQTLSVSDLSIPTPETGSQTSLAADPAPPLPPTPALMRINTSLIAADRTLVTLHSAPSDDASKIINATLRKCHIATLVEGSVADATVNPATLLYICLASERDNVVEVIQRREHHEKEAYREAVAELPKCATMGDSPSGSFLALLKRHPDAAVAKMGSLPRSARLSLDAPQRPPPPPPPPRNGTLSPGSVSRTPSQRSSEFSSGSTVGDADASGTEAESELTTEDAMDGGAGGDEAGGCEQQDEDESLAQTDSADNFAGDATMTEAMAAALRTPIECPLLRVTSCSTVGSCENAGDRDSMLTECALSVIEEGSTADSADSAVACSKRDSLFLTDCSTEEGFRRPAMEVLV